jgi:hypothetical protein
MASDHDPKRYREQASDDDAARYRQAAEDALQQLDWCIGYLHGIRKSELSARLARNRTAIKRNLMQEPTTPLPSSETSQA